MSAGELLLYELCFVLPAVRNLLAKCENAVQYATFIGHKRLSVKTNT